MKKYTFLFIWMLFGLNLFSQTTSSTHLIASFPSEGISNVYLELPGQAETRTWAKSEVRIMMNVTVDIEQKQLDFLVKEGFYDISFLINPTKMNCIAINRKHKSEKKKINGVEITEKFSFTVWLPEGAQLVQTEGMEASR